MFVILCNGEERKILNWIIKFQLIISSLFVIILVNLCNLYPGKNRESPITILSAPNYHIKK